MSVHRTLRHCLAGAAGLAVMGAYADLAEAGPRSYSQIQNMSAGSGDIRIQNPGEGATNRSIVMPIDKSSVIELPENVMDVIVSNPDIVEAVVHTARRTVLIAKSSGETNAFFYGHDGRELLNLDIRVARDIDGLEDLIRAHAEGSEVTVQSVNNNILLTGSVPNAATLDKVEKLASLWVKDNTTATSIQPEVVNLMTVMGKDQVMLKVRIVELQRSVTKQLGFNLNAVAQLGDSTVNLINNVALPTGAGLTAGFDFANGTGGDLSSLGGALQALERVGLVRTLAEPTLTAISGETASFLSGGEFPLLTRVFRDEQGFIQRSFEYKPFGVSLGFTPVVLSEGLISLNISTEVSEPTTEGSFETEGLSSDILGIRVRRAETVVEMPAGGSLVIAGLIREESRVAADGTPVAKDIPGIGALFRNRDELTTQTELVIIVTPYLVDSTHPDKLQTPMDGFVPANEKESFLLGRLNKVYAGTTGARVPAGTLDGPFGHVVD